MNITALKEQIKNPDRVNVFVDGTYSFSMTISEVVDYKIRIGTEVDGAALEALKKTSSDGKTRMRAYEWLMNRPHSTRELRDYLRRKKVEIELVEKLVAEFTQKKVLSDERFAEWYTDRAVRKNKSVRALQNELRGKGVQTTPNDVAKIATSDMAALEALLVKLAGRPRYADQARLIRYLQGKGFSYSDIKASLKLREPEQDGA